ncbi:response regulator transcription factor [Kitasatospora sp. NPDC088391]|uniref:response regulator transcription factor n=1 Tax=Kitasatospora sp. NPDC088391 TaxID=3364074 RepID=UPI00380F643A
MPKALGGDEYDHQGIHLCAEGVAPPPWVRETDLSLLTGRELDILRALGECRPNAAIAARFRITERTVKKHVASILLKLGITSRTEAAIVAVFTCRDDHPTAAATGRPASVSLRTLVPPGRV